MYQYYGLIEELPTGAPPFGWFSGLSVPVRARPGLHPSQQPSLAFVYPPSIHVQDATGGAGNNTAAGTVAATFASPVSINGLVVGVVFWGDNTNSVTGIADDKGNTYTVVDTVPDSPNTATAVTFYKEGLTNGPKTVTVTFNNPTNFQLIVISEYSGCATSSAIDGHNAHDFFIGVTAGANSLFSGSFVPTPSTNGDLIWGAVTLCGAGSETYTAGTSPNAFTGRVTYSPAAGTLAFTEDFIQSSAGSIQTTFGNTLSGAGSAAMAFGIAFKPVAPPTTTWGWFTGMSEPQRAVPGLKAVQQQTFTFGAPPIIPSFGYYQQMSEPVRVLPGLRAPQQPTFAFGAVPIIPSFGYYEPLSEPQRSPSGLKPPQQQALAFIYPAVSEFIGPDKYMQWLSEPVRRLLFNAAAQQFFAGDTSVIPITQLMPWFGALSEPVRLLPSLKPSLQQAFTFDPFPFIPSLGWYEALSEPVRLRQALIAAQQAFAAFTYNPPPINIFDNWYQPLSEPVRLKPGLLAALQQAFTIAPPLPINPAQFETWYQQLSEPQRQKIGLLAALQQAWVGPPRLLPAPSFTAVMRAIEQFDIMLAGGSIFSRPGSGEIGVLTAKRTTSEIGIIAAHPVSGETSISPPVNVPATTTTVTPIFGKISVRKV